MSKIPKTLIKKTIKDPDLVGKFCDEHAFYIRDKFIVYAKKEGDKKYAIQCYGQLKERSFEEWVICHPGTNEIIKCKSFEEAYKWFEGHNIPYKVVNGVQEPFEKAHERVHDKIRSHT